MRRTKPRPVGECKRCGEWRRSQVVTFVICHHCYWKEPKAVCGLCHRLTRFTADNGGICLECKLWGWGPQEIKCVRCGKNRPPAARRSELCRSCHERRGRGKCSHCDRDCSFELKTAKLCKRCAHNHQAPKRLRIFIEKIRISNELNRSLFQNLVERIDWDTVDEEFRRRICEFGTFLQSHTLEQPLKWSSIRKVCYELKAHRFRRVRECLEDAGDLLLGPASEKPDEINIDPLRPVRWMPRDVRQIMERYERWLCEDRNNTPLTRQGHFGTLSRFWKCWAKRGVIVMADVKASHVEEFLYTLSVQWKCVRCAYTKKVRSRGESSAETCENSACRAVGSFKKTIRCKKETVYAHRGVLRIFFGWLRDVEQAIEDNPAPTPNRKHDRKRRAKAGRKRPATIQYYDWEIISALLDAMEDPNTPAEEAMILYLTLHHGFFIRELLTVRFPAQCRPQAFGGAPTEPLEEVLKLEWLPRKLSRNRQFLGRSAEVFTMEPTNEAWIRDLAARFIHERTQKLRDVTNPYLFVAAKMRSPRGPVTYGYLRQLVQRATSRVTGRACTIGILSKSSRLLYSEFGGYEGVKHLREMGLCPRQALTYAWAQRIRVIPKQAKSSAPFASHRGSRLTVPLIDVFGIPTEFDSGLNTTAAVAL